MICLFQWKTEPRGFNAIGEPHFYHDCCNHAGNVHDCWCGETLTEPAGYEP